MGVYSLTKSTINNWTKYSSMMAGSLPIPLPTDFQLISSQFLSATTSSVTFSSIPSTYQHLQLRITARMNTGTWAGLNVNINSDTGTNYSKHKLARNGSSVMSQGVSPDTTFDFATPMPGASSASGMYGAYVLDISDYAKTTKNKTLKMLSGNTDITNANAIVSLASSVWLSTAAINSVTFTVAGSNFFIAGSRFSLYGWN